MIDKGRVVDVGCMGFSKAFDKICHGRLIEKIRIHWINSDVEWFRPGTLQDFLDQPAGVFADLFNFSFLRSDVPTCFKRTLWYQWPRRGSEKTSMTNDQWQ